VVALSKGDPERRPRQFSAAIRQFVMKFLPGIGGNRSWEMARPKEASPRNLRPGARSRLQSASAATGPATASAAQSRDGLRGRASFWFLVEISCSSKQLCI
jgi:hypothetical protein